MNIIYVKLETFSLEVCKHFFTQRDSDFNDIQTHTNVLIVITRTTYFIRHDNKYISFDKKRCSPF